MMQKGVTASVGLYLGPILFSAITILVPFTVFGNELTFASTVVLASTFWMAVWWITEAVPIYVTSLLPLIVFPALGVTSFEHTAINYADSIIFLFLGGFLLAKAVEKSNLHTRFAYKVIQLFGTNPKYIVSGFMLVTWFLAAWMSNTATTILMLPIALAVISMIRDIDKQRKFVVCLLLSVAYSASIGGVTTLIGTPPNAIFASLSNSITGTEITFTQWIFLGLPISAISLLVTWLYMIRFGSKINNINSDIFEKKDVIAEKLRRLGPMNRNEKIVGLVFFMTVSAWITNGVLWKDTIPIIDDSMIAIASAILLFMIPSSTSSSTSKDLDLKKNNNQRTFDIATTSEPSWENKHGKKAHNEDRTTAIPALLDWNSAMTIPWGILILIGGGLALANAFTTTGLGDWIAMHLDVLGNTHYIIIILVFVTLAILPTEMISNTATAALLLPISASIAGSMGVNPILLMAPVALASSYGFIMAVGTPPNAIVYSSGYITTKEMARAGLPLDIISIVMVTILSSILVPLVFGIN